MFLDTITVRWQYEDQLEIDMTPEMFRASEVVDGVRMYPFIITDEGKFYLEVTS